MSYVTVEGELNASGKHFAVVAARWHASITDRLINSALETITSRGGLRSNITLVRVPGSFEIPVICKELAASKQFEAIIALGTLLRGDTDHYRLISDTLADGLSKSMLEFSVPITFGVITADTEELALERAGANELNKGHEAALAAIEMANLFEKLRSNLGFIK